MLHQRGKNNNAKGPQNGHVTHTQGHCIFPSNLNITNIKSSMSNTPMLSLQLLTPIFMIFSYPWFNSYGF